MLGITRAFTFFGFWGKKVGRGPQPALPGVVTGCILPPTRGLAQAFPGG